jgi:hypothetical protein
VFSSDFEGGSVTTDKGRRSNKLDQPLAASDTAYRKKFSGKYAFRIIKGGVGHNLPQEAPQAFANAVIEVDGY